MVSTALSRSFLLIDWERVPKVPLFQTHPPTAFRVRRLIARSPSKFSQTAAGFQLCGSFNFGVRDFPQSGYLPDTKDQYFNKPLLMFVMDESQDYEDRGR